MPNRRDMKKIYIKLNKKNMFKKWKVNNLGILKKGVLNILNREVNEKYREIRNK